VTGGRACAAADPQRCQDEGVRTARPGLVAAWIVVAAGVSAAFHIGKLAPAIPTLQEQLGVSLVQAGWLVSLVQLAGMLLGVLIGTVADGLGLRRTMLTGLGLVTVAGVVGGFTHSVAGLLLLRALEGIGVLLSVVPAPGLIRRLLDSAQVTRMLGVWGAYVPFGTGIALIVGPMVIHGVGWPGWWWAVAVLSGLMVVAVAVTVPADPARPAGPSDVATSGVSKAGVSKAGVSKAGVSKAGAQAAGVGVGVRTGFAGRVRATLGARGPWLAAIVFGLYASQWMAVIGFLPTVYAQAGWTGALGAWLSGIVAFVNVAGNLAGGWLLHRGRAPAHLLTIGLAGQALGSFLAFASVTQGAPVAQYAGALAFSAVGCLVPGTVFALAPGLAPSEQTVSTTVGWIQQLSSTGQVLGPPLAAAVASAVGGWSWTWVVTVVTSALGSAAAFALGAVVRSRAGARHP
jgi:CP family cyanate transporter-like MFS transporter